MLLSYNWQILDSPIEANEQIENYLSIPEPSGSELIVGANESFHETTIQTMLLNSPVIGFIFSYLIEEPTDHPPQIHLFPELLMFEEKIELSILQQRRSKNHIYQLIRVEDCQCYQAILTFLMRIKFIEGSNSTANSIEHLLHLVGSRKINSHSFQTYSIIKKEVCIEEPLLCEVNVNSKGYLLFRISRPEDNLGTVTLKKLQLLTWLSPELKTLNEECKQIPEITQSGIQLNSGEAYNFLVMVPTLSNSQSLKQISALSIPYSLIYSVEKHASQVFKMIKKVDFKEGQLLERFE